MRRLRILSPAAAIAVLLGACDLAPSPADTGTPQQVAIAVAPPDATVVAGRTVAFAATVTGSEDLGARWDVVEDGGGTIDADGRYTAPASPGTYRVRATANADPQVFAEGVVTVRPPVGVAVAPATTEVVAGGTVTFTALVANAANAAVTWSVAGASCGSITPAGVYTAPAAPATCSVVATSQEDATKAATATVVVFAPVAVAMTPSPAATNACKSLTFAATVTGAADRAVTWSVQEGAAGGTVTSAGVYTAPATAGTYHVVATSRADPTKRAISAVTVTHKILSMAMNPPTATLTPRGTMQFTATVTTTCGSFLSTRAVAAPAG